MKLMTIINEKKMIYVKSNINDNVMVMIILND